MLRCRPLPAALVPTVLAGAIALPLALGAVIPAALAQDGPPPRATLTDDQQAHAALTERTAVAARLAQEQALARDTRTAQRAAAEAASRAAAEQAAADRAAAERRDAERASRSRRTSSGSPRAIAQALLAERGQGDQFGCLDRLWVKESGWDPSATNPSSGAYGIPQALPAGKMASAGSDWRTNPATQIRWGIGYISERYGSPCAARRHSQRNDWY